MPDPSVPDLVYSLHPAVSIARCKSVRQVSDGKLLNNPTPSGHSRHLQYRTMGDCGECARLREEYTTAVVAHRRLEGELQTALAEHKGEIATLLIIAVKAAKRAMESAHRELEKHQLKTHGAADGSIA